MISRALPRFAVLCLLAACSATPAGVGKDAGAGGSCNASTCLGCCQGSLCVSLPTSTACGKGGAACQVCSNGDACSDGVCGGSSACTGCLDSSGACVGGTSSSACGVNGATCKACGTGSTCNFGTCSSGCTSGCMSNGACVAGTSDAACGSGGASCTDCTQTSQTCADHICNTASTCNATTCANGCCDASGTCQSGGFLNSACGKNGASCQVCAGSQQCVNSACTTACGPSNCVGCCDSTGTCQASTTAHCGSNGASCNTCDASASCSSGSCVSTSCSTSCPGCCSGSTCNLGNTVSACGIGGNACGPCASGQACTNGACVVDPNSLWDLFVTTGTVPTYTSTNGNWDFDSPPDPYVEVILDQGQSDETVGYSIEVDNTLSPAWNVNLTWTLTSSGASVSGIKASLMKKITLMEVWDSDGFSVPAGADDDMGSCNITGGFSDAVFSGDLYQIDCTNSSQNVHWTVFFKLKPH